MIPKKMRLAASVLVALLLTIPGASAAQQKEKDSYPDVGIMNSVLNQLLKGTSGKSHRSFDVNGSYLPGYGLLFVVTAGNRFLRDDIDLKIGKLNMKSIDSSMAVFDSAMKEYDKAMKMYDKKMAGRDSIMAPSLPNIRVHAPRVVVRNFERKEREGLTKEETAGLDKGVMKFFENYADAENRLSPTQRISVVILTGSSSPARFYSVTRKQVSDFRAGSESANAFSKKVQIAGLKEKHESVGIMETILDKSAGNGMPGGRHFMFGPHSEGIYLKGLGAFFVCNITELPDFDGHDSGKKSGETGTAELENRIIRALGTYGSSLRFLPTDESVLVSLQLDRPGAGNESVLIGLKKKDIDSYMRNEIKFSALQKRAVIVRNQ